MIDIDGIAKRLKSYDEAVVKAAKDALRQELQSSEYVTVERDTYKVEAIRLSEENARLTVALQGKTSPIYSFLDPGAIDTFADMFKMRMDRDWYSRVEEVDVLVEEFVNGVDLALANEGKTLVVTAQPKKEGK